jgi:hypothetical protein
MCGTSKMRGSFATLRMTAKYKTRVVIGMMVELWDYYRSDFLFSRGGSPSTSVGTHVPIYNITRSTT